MLIPRGQASVQLKIVRQRHTPSLSARISSRSSRPLVARVEDEPVGVARSPPGRRTTTGPRTTGTTWCTRRTGCTWSCRRSGRGPRRDWRRSRSASGLVDQVGHDALELVEEALHVDDQVLDDRQAGQRRDRDPSLPELVDPDLAGQPVAPVDEHRVRAAHAVCAGPPEGQRPVLLVLDLVEQVEHAVTSARRRPSSAPSAASGPARGRSEGCVGRPACCSGSAGSVDPGLGLEAGDGDGLVAQPGPPSLVARECARKSTSSRSG